VLRVSSVSVGKIGALTYVSVFEAAHSASVEPLAPPGPLLASRRHVPSGAKLSCRRAAWAGGHCFEAPGVCLPLRAVPRLGQDQNGGLAGCKPGAVAGFPIALSICMIEDALSKHHMVADILA